MSKPPLISAQECIQTLQKAGYVVSRQKGSHISLRRNEPPPARTVVVPNHKEIDRATLRNIIRQAGLTVEEFVALLDE